jgi:hypothetical protein
MNVSPVRPVRSITARARGAAAALVLTALLAPAADAASAEGAPSPRAAHGSLAVSPSVYVAGQAVTLTGSMGKSGKQTVHLQTNLNRPGDTWLDVPDTSFQTKRSGAFSYHWVAPSMFNVGYRVAGGGLATPAFQFNARPQEITLTLQGRNADSPFYEVPPGAPFTVEADTTPAVRSALGVAPPIPGRTVTLQQRVNGNQWQSIATTTTDADGLATFGLTAPSAGQQVLRARQEPWTAGSNEIGWYASFPAYFSFVTPPVQPAPQSRLAQAVATKSAARPTAAERYKWGASIFDFGWESGQDLDSPPSQGTKPKGSWIDTSDGTGRATPFNGGLVLQSKLVHVGEGDRGTTAATLTGSAQKTGRWEFRLQGHVFESGATPYRFLLELVPQGTPVTTCSPESVVVADFTMGTPGMNLGVRSQSKSSVWSRHTSGTLGETPFNAGVEVAKDHVTWYRDGKPIGTVKDKKASLGKKLVPRLRLIGLQTEMNGAQVDSDWQRAFPLKTGEQVKNGPALTRAAYSASC